MKNRALYLILTLILMSSIEAKTNLLLEHSKLFVGHIDGCAVFNSYDERKIYILKSELELLMSYSSHYNLISVNNEFICFEDESSSVPQLVILSKGLEKKYKVSSSLTYSTIDSEGVFYYTDINNFNIKCIRGGKEESLGIKGFVINKLDGCLYYSNTHDEEIISANADIFEYDLKNRTSRKILTNVSGESTLILPHGKYIYEELLTRGEFRPILYSVEQQKYALLSIEEEFMEATPYYSIQKNALVFYQPSTLKMKVIDIPEKFDSEKR